ncbi:MAG: hypothetical protein HQL54_12595, partial [Magnetococcales bacterium]|nr:hypothetical protein [Magnetococcales bacterium]
SARSVVWPCFSLILAIALSGCALIPAGPTVEQLASVQKQYLIDQQQRQNGLKIWAVSGIVDLETPEETRRTRMELIGLSVDRGRMRIHGPMRQIAGDLVINTDWIRLVLPASRSYVQVPATIDGLKQLSGLGLSPEMLLPTVLGVADRIVGADGEKRLPFRTVAGERVRLDWMTGHILERAGTLSDGNPYRVRYQWPEQWESHDEISGAVMPKSVEINWGGGEKRQVQLVMRSWHRPEQSSEAVWQRLITLPDGFVEGELPARQEESRAP